MRNLIRAVSRVPSLFPVKLITVPCRGLNQLLCRTTLPKLSSQHMTCSSHLLSIIHGKIAVCVLEQTAWKHSSFNREKGKKTSDDDDDDFDLKKEVNIFFLLVKHKTLLIYLRFLIQIYYLM